MEIYEKKEEKFFFLDIVKRIGQTGEFNMEEGQRQVQFEDINIRAYLNNFRRPRKVGRLIVTV